VSEHGDGRLQPRPCRGTTGLRVPRSSYISEEHSLSVGNWQHHRRRALNVGTVRRKASPPPRRDNWVPIRRGTIIVPAKLSLPLRRQGESRDSRHRRSDPEFKRRPARRPSESPNRRIEPVATEHSRSIALLPFLTILSQRSELSIFAATALIRDIIKGALRVSAACGSSPRLCLDRHPYKGQRDRV